MGRHREDRAPRHGGRGKGGNDVNPLRTVAVAVSVSIALGASAGAASAQSGSPSANQATEVGITSSTIRIGVIADVDNAASPGIFAGSPTAVTAFAKFINASGGLAGRKLQVDFMDSHLTDTAARNAIIKACSQDFAIVGTEALFLNNVDDLVSCPDRTGAATGLPDLASFSTATAEQCSPVTFSANPGQLDCSTLTQNPQTYRDNQGAIKYFLRTRSKSLHGIFVYSNDLKTAANAGIAIARGNEAGGVKSDGEIGISALAPQSGFTPIVQQMKAKQSNYAFDIGQFSSMVALRKEALLQGIDSKNVIWDCSSNCYNPGLIQQAGSAVEGQYVELALLPFNETKANKALANYVNAVGASKVDGFGAYSWIASLLLRDSVNAVVKKGGNNALTRKALLAQLAATTSFNGDGMWTTTNVGQRIPSPCFLLLQVKNGQFTRVYPTKAGTFDCNRSNAVSVKANLLAG
jgi:hypothetical protein